jgi:predicted nucleic acid-binding protein
VNPVFADSGHWIAVLNPREDLHETAMTVSRSLGTRTIVTSEMVLTEVLNFYSVFGPMFRERAVQLVKSLREDLNVIVVGQTSEQFDRAMSLYVARPDKTWGLTDCSSFAIMNDLRITEALAHDHHFVQAEFRALLRGD